jgi:hypothetical protein
LAAEPGSESMFATLRSCLAVSIGQLVLDLHRFYKQRPKENKRDREWDRVGANDRVRGRKRQGHVGANDRVTLVVDTKGG